MSQWDKWRTLPLFCTHAFVFIELITCLKIIMYQQWWLCCWWWWRRWWWWWCALRTGVICSLKCYLTTRPMQFTHLIDYYYYFFKLLPPSHSNTSHIQLQWIRKGVWECILLWMCVWFWYGIEYWRSNTWRENDVSLSFLNGIPQKVN